MKILRRLIFVVTLIALHAHAQIAEIPDPNLERAIRQTLQLPDHTPITQQQMDNLTELHANNKQIENLIGLEYATHLKKMNCGNNKIRDITPLIELPLEHLDIGDNPIADFNPFANLTSLKFLNLSGIRRPDLSPLSNLTQLEKLVAIYCEITDITPLANLKQLTAIDLSWNFIVDVSPLANLSALEDLWIENNWITDFSPLQGLSLNNFRYDEICMLPDPPIQARIANRSLPSIFQAFDPIINLPELSGKDRIAYHDLFFTHIPFRTHFQPTPQGYQLAGSIDRAIAERDELLAKNPNMLFLVEIRIGHAHVPYQYPEDWFGWLRDDSGIPVATSPSRDTYVIDFRIPEVQDAIVQQAISVSKCGLYDGIVFDVWSEGLVSVNDPNIRYEYDEETHHDLLQKELQARTTILRRIREAVPDDFLIIINHNRYKSPLSIPYINGGFMETFYDEPGYTRSRIVDIEENLIWYEDNAREPQINCLRALGIGSEPSDSPNNRRWMRLFTTMSLTLSDGYVLYTIGHVGGQKQYQKHIWYPFWDADLGQPIGPTAQRYQDIEGLYIREFINGWAVYNRSGKEQAITLPRASIGVSSNKSDITHLLPDLDGEIYLRIGKPFDLNRDGTINVLDLIVVSHSFGTTAGDVNGDGTTNILDLTLVASHFR